MVRSVDAFETVLSTLVTSPQTLLGASLAYVAALGVSSAIPAGALVALPFLTGGLYGLIYNKMLGGSSTPKEAFKRTGEAYYPSLLFTYVVQAVGLVLLIGPASVLLSLIGDPTSILSIAVVVVFGVLGTLFYMGTQFAPVVVVREDVRAVEAYQWSLTHARNAFGGVALYTAIRLSVPFSALTAAAALFAQDTVVTTAASGLIVCVTLLLLPVFNALYHTAYYEEVR